MALRLPRPGARTWLLTALLVAAAISSLLSPLDAASMVRAVAVGGAGGLAGGLLAGAIGLISVPLIVLFLGLPVHAAVATNLFQSIFTASAGALQHGRAGNVNTRLAAPLLLGAAVGAPLGGLVSVNLPPTVLLGLFSIILLLMSVRVAWETLRPSTSERSGFDLRAATGVDVGAALGRGVARVFGQRSATWFVAVVERPIEGTFRGHEYSIDRVTPLLLGAGIGFVAGLLGIGGGFLITPLVSLLLNVPALLAVGTGLVVISGNALFGSIPHLLAGNISFTAGLLLAVGGGVGAMIGSKLSHLLPERVLHGLFAALLVVVGLRMMPW